MAEPAESFDSDMEIDIDIYADYDLIDPKTIPDEVLAHRTPAPEEPMLNDLEDGPDLMDSILHFHVAIFSVTSLFSSQGDSVKAIQQKISTIYRIALSSDFIVALQRLCQEKEGWNMYKQVLCFREANATTSDRVQCQHEIQTAFHVEIDVETVAVLLANKSRVGPGIGPRWGSLS